MITTVTGKINRDQLGCVLSHEHIFCDLRNLVAHLPSPEFYEKVTLGNHGLLTRNPYAVLDNAVLEDPLIQAEELLFFKNAGGNTIVDVTTKDFGRNPEALREISEKTGIHIIAGCGYYIDSAVCKQDKEKSVIEIYDEIVRDLTVGMDGTGIKAGVIGEIGTSEEMTEFEYKSLEAAALAQKDLKVGMHIHACLWNEEGLRALKFVKEKGADLSRVCIDHGDVVLNMDYIRRILDMGAMIDFDNFGKEFYVDRHNRNLLKGSFATDRERVTAIRDLIEEGYLHQILITNDICLKSMTHYYGGWGYDHVLTNIIPMLEDYGVTADQIKTMYYDNPKTFLT